MPDIETPLTEDEYTVLMITGEGGTIADLGRHSRWHAPINSLLKRGFLVQHDKFNHEITESGREVLADKKVEEQIESDRATAAANAIQVVQADAQAAVEAAAHAMVRMARASSKVTGDPPRVAFERWLQVLVSRAKELLNAP